MLKPSSRQGSHERKLVKTNQPDYFCLACDKPTEDWTLVCPHCSRTDTITELEHVSPDDNETPGRTRATKATTVSLVRSPMLSTGSHAWNTVLGGGFTRPSSVLISGPSGVGKSTSALRMAEYVGARVRRPVLYASAEMPKEFLCKMGARLGLTMRTLYIQDSGHFEDVIDDILDLRPVLVVWDSIQRHSVDDELGDIELRKVVRGAIDIGKRIETATVFLSQVTKEEVYRGDSGIGHDCDVVIELRKVDEEHVSIECPVKNRFAPTPRQATERLSR